MKNTSISFIGNNAVDVTGSCTIIKHNDIRIALDCGMIQTNNIVADYKANKELAKKIKPKDIQFIICSHLHNDHIGLLPVVYHIGCQAHIYIPAGSKELMKIMLEDSVKIMISDALRLEQKHGIKVAPLATEEDIERVINRVIEIPFENPHTFYADKSNELQFTYYSAGHIINSAQILLSIYEGYTLKRIGYTGDICNEDKGMSVESLVNLPKCNVPIGECTYSDKTRCYSMKKDRWYDEVMIQTAISEYNKILIPVFSLQRLEDILACLKKLNIKEKIYIDAPLGEKIYKRWPKELDFEQCLDLTWVTLWEDSKALQMRDEHCIILSTSGMLSAGRAMFHLKHLLPNPKNAVLFCGYSSENTLASEIKNGARQIKVDGELIDNNAQIYSLNSFSGHSNYEQLMTYYQQLQYDKLYLVHSQFDTKVTFANELEKKLHDQGKSAKAIVTNADTRIYL